jgi:Leucine-rich repeat (LRR) protein
MLDNKEMKTWPNSISLLKKLTSISIYDEEFQQLPDDALKNFPDLSILGLISTKYAIYLLHWEVGQN